ncbi:hypothetical protein GCM10008967_03480 [Bacillus carboniphilus]|uniref:Glycine zipper family protein n=1 Tax=Bacillus carboniphilus TaxID=86663 RepID=A0ABN0VSF9_9BACI
MFIPGFLLLGIGIGMLFDQTGAGTLIGLGLGFVAENIEKNLKKKKKDF